MTDVFFIRFSVVNAASVQNVRGTCERKTYVVKGQKIAKDTGVCCYMQCSFLTRKGLETVSDKAIIAILTPKKHTVKKQTNKQTKKRMGSRWINCCSIM
uniref:Uncharacterized protein n=1 Tax=Rhinolophus ferrumequinum TaxID=59479 RepID=A0A671E3F8_RHIFE